MTQKTLDTEKRSEIINGKVLIVHNEETPLNPLCAELERDGYKVVKLHNAEDAVQRIKKERFNMLIADTDLQGTDGIKMIKEIRQIDQRLPVVVTSNNPSIKTCGEALALGVQSYITEPAHDIQKVLRLLKSAMLKEDKNSKSSAVIEEKSKNIECLDCLNRFQAVSWQPLAECPSCAGTNTFPLPEKTETDIIADETNTCVQAWRFGRIAHWAELINSSQLSECLNIQSELKRNKKEISKIGQIMLSKGYLNKREVKAVLRAQSIKRPTEEEKRFGKLAVFRKFITQDQLERCINIQLRLMLYLGRAPHIGEILLEKGYIAEAEVKAILKFQKEEEKAGLLQLLLLWSLSPIKRLKMRFIDFCKHSPRIKVSALALIFLILTVIFFAAVIGKEPLLQPLITVIDESGEVKRVASGNMTHSSGETYNKLFYALYCRKDNIYFPLKIESQPGGSFALEPCPKCGTLEHVDIPPSVEKDIKR